MNFWSKEQACRAVWWLWAVLFLIRGVDAQDRQVTWKSIEPPADWKKSADAWITASRSEWDQFQRSLASPASRRQVPVLLQATYVARFDGDRQLSGQLNWQIHRLEAQAGFVNLGRSTLAVSELQSSGKQAVHGLDPSGDWRMWSPGDQNSVTGRWSQWGEVRLSSRAFDLQFPRALASRLELELPPEWEAKVAGITPEVRPAENSPGRVWTFDLGRQLTVPLRIGPVQTSGGPRILVRENSVYRLTTTDDQIRLRSELDCLVDGARDAELVLAVPKPLRVFNVMLSNEIPVKFERDLGSESDQLRIPLRAIATGQRISVNVFAEARRSSDKAFSLPRFQPQNAILQEGILQLEIDRPLEIQSVVTQGVRQVLQTDDVGKEFRSYELLQADGQISVNVGEPSPVPSGEVRFLTDMRGESPRARARVRMSIREGELYSPQLRIPAGWDMIGVTLADTIETTPAAWSQNPMASGDSLVGLELRQPIRPDRDCTVLIDLKQSSPPSDGLLRLPAPRIVGARECFAQGVVWDHAPWELRDSSPTPADVSNDPPDAEMLLSLNWGEPPGAPVVPTSVRIADWKDTSDPQFQRPGITYAEADDDLRTVPAVRTPSPLSAHVEVETTTTRIANSHTHQATFRLNQSVRPSEIELTLPPAAVPVRVTTNETEIPFVRQDSRLLLDASTSAISELVLEYRTEAQSGWIVTRDPMAFPRINAFITEFVWRLNLDSQRRLYKLPLTAAATPRDVPPVWQRLLGPLARIRGESLFNPLHRSDWKALINGTIRDEVSNRREELWFVAPRIPDDFPLKTWNLSVVEGLARVTFLSLLALGIALRKVRVSWFRRSWIYLGGVFLVLAVFVSEPYAPIAGGAFLGSVLAILVPRRFAIGTDWLSNRSSPRPSTWQAATGAVILMIGAALWSSHTSLAQEAASSPTAAQYFVLPATTESPEAIVFESSVRELWDDWKAGSSTTDWLLSRSQYQVESSAAGPVVSATYQLYRFGKSPIPLKIPLEGVSLERVEGILDGQPVRLIPATNGRGLVLPLLSDLSRAPGDAPPPPPPPGERTGPEPTHSTLELRFRLLPDSASTQDDFTGIIPPLPESTIVFASRWNITLADNIVPSPSLNPIPIGPATRIKLSPPANDAETAENLGDVKIRTLVECGALGARVQTGVLATLVDPMRPALVKLRLPRSLWVQSINGSAVKQSDVNYSDSTATIITLAIQTDPESRSVSPIEIISFLPRAADGFRITPPVWKPSGVSTNSSVAEPSLIGVIARPGLMVSARDQTLGVTPLSPQAYSDSLFSGIVWQVPDLAWSCRDGEGPVWNTVPIVATGRAQIHQTLTIDLPRSRWQLDGKIESNLGAPFEHLFTIDPRIEIQRATVLQDGAERLLRWTVLNDPATNRRQLHLTIRDGQPGVQSVRIDGTWSPSQRDWIPPEASYQSGQTVDSSVTLKHSPRITTEIQSEVATTHGEIDKDYLYRPGELNAPRSVRINPIQEERLARVWVELRPRSEESWQVTVRTQLKDKLPASQPIRIDWDAESIADVRAPNRRENVRQLAKGKGLQWRPQSTSTHPGEMTLTASWSPTKSQRMSLPMPSLSGVRWSEVWVSLPKGAGYRPLRQVASLAAEVPANWPATWNQTLQESRLDLYSGNLEPIEIEEYSDDTTIRLLWAESLVWMGQIATGDEIESSCFGTTKYLLISERAVTLKIAEAAKPRIRAISVNGIIHSTDQPLRLPARTSDLSQEVIVWWEMPEEPSTLTADWIEFPQSQKYPHQWALVPPHQQYVLSQQPNRRTALANYWLSRTESMLQAAAEFRGAPWRVDGPLMHHLADSRNELAGIANLSEVDLIRREKVDSSWKEFTRGGSNISSPISDSRVVSPEIGLDAAMALCGESQTIWLPLQNSPTISGPVLVDRRWALGVTATLASVLSLAILMWFVRLFRRFDVPERIAARPNASLIVVGIIWWISLRPSVLGLGLALVGLALWLRDRWYAPLPANAAGQPESAGSSVAATTSPSAAG